MPQITLQSAGKDEAGNLVVSTTQLDITLAAQPVTTAPAPAEGVRPSFTFIAQTDLPAGTALLFSRMDGKGIPFACIRLNNVGNQPVTFDPAKNGRIITRYPLKKGDCLQAVPLYASDGAIYIDLEADSVATHPIISNFG